MKPEMFERPRVPDFHESNCQKCDWFKKVSFDGPTGECLCPEQSADTSMDWFVCCGYKSAAKDSWRRLAVEVISFLSDIGLNTAINLKSELHEKFHPLITYRYIGRLEWSGVARHMCLTEESVEKLHSSMLQIIYVKGLHK